jgi:hypothetical protein
MVCAFGAHLPGVASSLRAHTLYLAVILSAAKNLCICVEGTGAYIPPFAKCAKDVHPNGVTDPWQLTNGN